MLRQEMQNRLKYRAHLTGMSCVWGTDIGVVTANASAPISFYKNVIRNRLS